MFASVTDMNKGKRSIALKKSKRERVTKMRAALPVFTEEEVIRHRLPLHEGIIREVERKGFINSAFYLKNLIEYQTKLKIAAGPDSLISNKPELKNEELVLKNLAQCLCKAETAHLANDTMSEVDTFLMTAVAFLGDRDDWWWLGHQILEQAVVIAGNYTADGGQIQSLAKYLLGKCLARKINDADGALYHLTEAKTLSYSMTWVPTRYYPKERDTVFTHVCFIIYEIRLAMAQYYMNIDTPLAIELSKMARKAALDACDYKAQSKAYITKGECELLINDTKTAVISFQKALAIQNMHENVEMMCESLLHLGTAYMKHGYFPLALQKFEEMKEYAQEKGIPYYVARAYKHLGEYYLQEGSPHKSTPYLHRALTLFNRGHFVRDAEATRNIAAISIGIELMSPYTKLITECYESNPNYGDFMTQLLEWKDLRVEFWGDSIRHISFTQADVHTGDDFVTPPGSNNQVNETEVEVIYENKDVEFLSAKSVDSVPQENQS